MAAQPVADEVPALAMALLVADQRVSATAVSREHGRRRDLRGAVSGPHPASATDAASSTTEVPGRIALRLNARAGAGGRRRACSAHSVERITRLSAGYLRTRSRRFGAHERGTHAGEGHATTLGELVLRAHIVCRLIERSVRTAVLVAGRKQVVVPLGI